MSNRPPDDGGRGATMQGAQGPASEEHYQRQARSVLFRKAKRWSLQARWFPLGPVR